MKQRFVEDVKAEVVVCFCFRSTREQTRPSVCLSPGPQCPCRRHCPFKIGRGREGRGKAPTYVRVRKRIDVGYPREVGVFPLLGQWHVRGV